MTKQKRRTYTQQFKVDAVRLITEQGYKYSEAARNLGINRSVLNRWKIALKSTDASAFPGKGHLSPESEKLQRLRKKVQQLQMEHGILNKSMQPRVCLLLGDPSGIGPELIVKLLHRAETQGLAKVLLLGERRVLEEAQRIVGVKLELALVASPGQFTAAPISAFMETNFLQPGAVVPGSASAMAGAAVIKSLKLALNLAKSGCIDGICYGPLNKQAMHLAGMQFSDEMHFFVHELGHKGDSGEINALAEAWTSRVTSHVPLSEVPRLITITSVQKAIRLIHHTMVAAGIKAPRIAVAALNPHAGEGGIFGQEEIDVIKPAITEAAAKGINVKGPYPSDTIFLKLKDGLFDAVVTMYHDQGQIALKLMGFQRGVTVAGGLPVAITTPAHGTAFDIAGQGRADVGAMVEAFKLVIRLAGCSKKCSGDCGMIENMEA